MVSTASLFGACHLGDVKKKPASSVVVLLGKALNGTPPPLRGRQLAQTPQKWQLRTNRPKHSDTIRFLVNGG